MHSSVYIEVELGFFDRFLSHYIGIDCDNVLVLFC